MKKNLLIILFFCLLPTAIDAAKPAINANKLYQQGLQALKAGDIETAKTILKKLENSNAKRQSADLDEAIVIAERKKKAQSASPTQPTMPVEQPVQEPTKPVKPVEPPIKQPLQEPIQTPVQEPAKPIEQPVKQPVKEPIKPIEQPVEHPHEKPVEEPIQIPIEPPVQPIEEPIEPPVQQPAEEPIQIPAQDPIVPVDEPVEQPIQQPIEEPIQVAPQEPVQPIDQPIEQPAEPPVELPAQEPIQPIEQPAQDPIIPIEQPVEPPIQQPIEEPIQAPTQEPAQPIEQPVEQPVEQPLQQPAKPIEQPPVEPPVSASVQLQEHTLWPGWYTRNAGRPLDSTQMKWKYRTICDQLGLIENPKIPQKAADTCRIATYNVHFWKNPFEKWNTPRNQKDFDRIMKIIKMVNADVLILQEVGGENNQWDAEFKQQAQELGYKHSICCSNSTKSVKDIGYLYNCIVSKFPITKEIQQQFKANPDTNVPQNHEQRCFVATEIELPGNKKVSIYGTHLEVRPIVARDQNGQRVELTPDRARTLQLQELISFIEQNETNANILIGADFNSFRKEDLQTKIGDRTIWNIIESIWPEVVKASDIPADLQHLADKQPPTAALDFLREKGYRDCFSTASILPPLFTNWTGTRIDFLFLNPRWNLPIKGCYTFYDWASDHIPVIIDIAI